MQTYVVSGPPQRCAWLWNSEAEPTASPIRGSPWKWTAFIGVR